MRVRGKVHDAELRFRLMEQVCGATRLPVKSVRAAGHFEDRDHLCINAISQLRVRATEPLTVDVIGVTLVWWNHYFVIWNRMTSAR